MPLQNRVLPTGEIVAIHARGTLTGNRGIIHGPDKQLSNKRWSHHAWISCVLEWHGRKREVMSGRKWTELFFLDEAVALAAGHRPCGYCRREAYNRFCDAWTTAFGARASAKAMDRILHHSRVESRTRQHLRTIVSSKKLPSGAMFQHDGEIFLAFAGQAIPFNATGYAAHRDMPQEDVVVLTPEPILKVLEAGYQPTLHSDIASPPTPPQSPVSQPHSR